MQIWLCFSLWPLSTSSCPSSFYGLNLCRRAHIPHDAIEGAVQEARLLIEFILTCCCCQFCHCTCWAHSTCDVIFTAWKVLLILLTVALSLRNKCCCAYWICWCWPGCRIGLKVGGSICGVFSIFADTTSSDVVLDEAVEAAILKSAR